ncbi:MAG: phosphatase [Firmicutes bacterium]|nr:phosphatase [Bacillota bacterium]MDH7494431.1 phosphatase [Bacillota bacterium]
MRLVADLHTHSIASGHAYNTIDEMARAAREAGLEMIAVTDHGPSIPGGPHRYYFGNLRVIPATIEGVEVLKGVEANIISPSGELDLPDRTLQKLEFVLAGFHVGTGYDGGTVEENTRAMIAAMENPHVDAIAHPGNPAFQVDVEEVVKAAKRLGKLLEINNSSLTIVRLDSRENCHRFAELAGALGVTVVIGSDAHHASRVGVFDAAVELAESAGLTEDLVLNTSTRRIMDFLRSRGKIRTEQERPEV